MPMVPRSGRKSTPDPAGMCRSTPFTPPSTGSRPRAFCGRGPASRPPSAAGAGASSMRSSRPAARPSVTPTTRCRRWRPGSKGISTRSDAAPPAVPRRQADHVAAATGLAGLHPLRPRGRGRRARRWFWRQAIRCAAAPPRPVPPFVEPQGRDSFMRTLMSDARHALRVFVRTPSYAIAVVAVLALGIGANTAIFSIVNAVLLRPLPFEQPDRLVRLFHIPPQSTFPGMPTFSLSPANFLDWQRDSRSFDGMAAYSSRALTLTGGNNAEALRIGVVGPDFFKV